VAHLTKPGWSKFHTHSNPTNLALFRHKITLYRFNQGDSYYYRGLKWEQGGAEPPSPPHFNHWLTPSNMLLHSLCYRAKFDHSGSDDTRVESVITETRQKHLTLAYRLSRSLEVIRTDTDRLATYDFLLVIHSNYGTVSYRFRDKRRFRLKIAHFPVLVYLTPPLRSSLWHFVTAFSDEKN